MGVAGDAWRNASQYEGRWTSKLEVSLFAIPTNQTLIFHKGLIELNADVIDNLIKSSYVTKKTLRKIAKF